MFHAVVHLDHQHAPVLHFDASEVHSDRIDAHHQVTRQHGGDEQATRAFFAAVCAALDGTQEVLVTGSHPVIGELRHYIEQHCPQLAPHIADYRPAAPLSPGQMLAMARQFFKAYDRMAGVPTPT